ncbi:MAG: redoxin domain-containing protein [Longimicrobiales bacterium]
MNRYDPTGSCDQTRALLLDMAEGSLDGAEAEAVRVHVADCPSCAADLRALSASWAALPDAKPASPSAEVRRRVLGRASAPVGSAPAGRPEAAAWSVRHWVGAAAVVMLATASAVGVSQLTRGPGAPGVSQGDLTAPGGRTQLALGDPIPSFAARDVFTGEPVSLDELRGDVVILNVWATWCLPCESEMPSMERLYRDLGPRGLRIVALSIDRESTHMVRRWVEERGLTFTVLHDSDGAFERAFAGSGVPETYVFDRAGALVQHVVGPRRWDEPASASHLSGLLQSDG